MRQIQPGSLLAQRREQPGHARGIGRDRLTRPGRPAAGGHDAELEAGPPRVRPRKRLRQAQQRQRPALLARRDPRDLVRPGGRRRVRQEIDATRRGSGHHPVPRPRITRRQAGLSCVHHAGAGMPSREGGGERPMPEDEHGAGGHGAGGGRRFGPRRREVARSNVEGGLRRGQVTCSLRRNLRHLRESARRHGDRGCNGRRRRRRHHGPWGRSRAGRGGHFLREAGAQGGEMRQRGQHVRPGRTEVDQARNLVDPRGPAGANHRDAGVRGADQRSLTAVPLEGELGQAAPLLLAQRRGALHCAQVGVDRTPDVREERLAHHRPPARLIGIDKGVQHQRDPPRRRIEARGAARLAIRRNLPGQLLEVRTLQHRQHVAAEAPRIDERIGAA